MVALGDPVHANVPEYLNDGTDMNFELRSGDHHDGMDYFGLSEDGTRRDPLNSRRTLLAMNHEATTDNFLHPNGSTPRPRPAAETDKEMAVHGTINNCGTSRTPWGTLLTGEENWAGYFTRASTDDAARGNDKSVVSLNRYGRAAGAASRHGWETSGSLDRYRRFDISKTGSSTDGTDDYRNELNTFGYMVEIDPYDPGAKPTKRTGLGRFAHESGAFSHLVPGRPLAVYMGDDSRNEYIYKWVSAAPWSAGDAARPDRLNVGAKYLDEGRLYVAKFHADGTGEWIELSIANPLI